MTHPVPLLILSLVGTFAVLGGSFGAAEEESQLEFPYIAYVSKRAAVARSGPGMSHYATDALPRGERVEVLERQAPWLAIRTPADSFSWVPGAKLKKTADGKSAEVIEREVPSWVGSNLDPVDQHVSQIKLRRGERVAVLGQSDVSTDEESLEAWVKIAPPDGERRWILAEDVGPDPPPDTSGTRNLPTSKMGESADTVAGWTDRTSGISRRGRIDMEDEYREGIPTTRRVRSGSSQDAATETGKETGKEAVKSSWSHLLNYPATSSFDDRLARLQLALSRAVAGGGTTQDMDMLEQRANQLIQNGKSSYERGQATLLLEAVREFRKLARRRKASVQRAGFGQSVDPSAIGTGLKSNSDVTTARGLLEKLAAEVQAVTGSEGATNSLLGDLGSTSKEDTPYLAQGWLMPVSSPARVAPPYVLMDRDGHPVAFITPAPGVNLRRYVDKEVGIMGQPAFEVLDRQHVVAHRAIELARHRDGPPPSRTASPWIRSREADSTGLR
jgi:hypothetical protein